MLQSLHHRHIQPIFLFIPRRCSSAASVVCVRGHRRPAAVRRLRVLHPYRVRAGRAYSPHRRSSAHRPPYPALCPVRAHAHIKAGPALFYVHLKQAFERLFVDFPLIVKRRQHRRKNTLKAFHFLIRAPLFCHIR